MITCCTWCCKILHWYCRKVFLRTFHTGSVRKWVTFWAAVEIWEFDLNGDLRITTLASVLYEDLSIRACAPKLNCKPCLRSEIAAHFVYCYHERHRLNIYKKKKNAPNRSCWQSSNSLLVLNNFSVYITNFQTGGTRHHCYIIRTFFKLLFSLESQLSLKWYKYVYPKLATNLHTNKHTSPATTAFCLHSVHNRHHTTAVIGLTNSQCLITLQSLTRNRACWIKR